MALHFPLLVNGADIGNFYAVRVSGGTNPDSHNTYNVAIDSEDGSWSGKVRHRYGDGAWTLVHKALTQRHQAIRLERLRGE